ncbi:hypothetical protein I7I51_02796 [Histoplasma capsulatum]|uniref:Uncharacterized protein n=1 Tax=Ajellomyces capsulatus TaxID=5037 RepID=A0A8A1MRC2_AJECA|nr:hypothetical protein I7I51_02796 [Histoplasma capsulatum]
MDQLRRSVFKQEGRPWVSSGPTLLELINFSLTRTQPFSATQRRVQPQSAIQHKDRPTALVSKKTQESCFVIPRRNNGNQFVLCVFLAAWVWLLFIHLSPPKLHNLPARTTTSQQRTADERQLLLLLLIIIIQSPTRTDRETEDTLSTQPSVSSPPWL